MCANSEGAEQDLKAVNSVQNEGGQTIARAPGNVNVGDAIAIAIEDTVVKKRKTRRGKSKRRNPNPYTKMSWQQRKNMQCRKFRPNIINHGQALAPFNSNQFLMEDHGDLPGIDDKLNKSDGAGSSAVPPRTRDSSFSVDSDGDFYSSPEDEEEFLTKEFDNAYEDLHAERLQAMSKEELIEEYLQLESKVELLTKRLRGKSLAPNEELPNLSTTMSGNCELVNSESVFQQEINKLLLENDELRRENEHLRSGICRTASSFSSSMDSESDSASSTCSSTSSNSGADAEVDVDADAEVPANIEGDVDGMKEDASPSSTTPTTPPPQPPPPISYAETNGFSPQPSSPTAV